MTEAKLTEDNVEVYTSEVLPPEMAQNIGLHRDSQVEFRYTTYYYGPDLNYFQRDLQKLLRERIGNPNLVLDAYYIRPNPKGRPVKGEQAVPSLREMFESKTYPGAPSGIPITVFPVESFSHPGKFALYSSTLNQYFGKVKDTFQEAVEGANKENLRMHGKPVSTPTAIPERHENDFYIDGKEVSYSTFVAAWKEEFAHYPAPSSAGTWQGKHRYRITTG